MKGLPVVNPRQHVWERWFFHGTKPRFGHSLVNGGANRDLAGSVGEVLSLSLSIASFFMGFVAFQ